MRSNENFFTLANRTSVLERDHPRGRLGRPTELVVYPGEYHEFKTPSHIKDRLERYLAWYNHYVKGDPAPSRPVPLAKSGE